MNDNKIVKFPGMRIELGPEISAHIEVFAEEAGVDPVDYAKVMLHITALEKLKQMREARKELGSDYPGGNDTPA